MSGRDLPDRFGIGNVARENGQNLAMTHRLTIDYLDDYRLIKNAFEALHQPGHYPFCLADILGYLERHPAVFALNAHLAGVNWYRHHLGELRTVGAAQTTLREAV